MSVAGVMMLVGGAVAQVCLGRVMASPWLVPDLLLVCMFLILVDMPRNRPLGVGVLAGLLVMVVTTRQPLVVGLAYGGIVVVVRSLAVVVDLTDSRIHLAVVAILETGLLALGLALGGRLSAALLVLAGVKLLITVASVPLLRPFVNSVPGR